MFLLKNANTEIEVKAHTCQIQASFVRTWLRMATKYVVENIADIQNYSSTNWDGTIFRVDNEGHFATGYLQEFVGLLESQGVKVSVVGVQSTGFKTSFETTYGKYTLFPHQQTSLHKALTNEVNGLSFVRGIINAATNSGKSLIIGAILANYGGYALVLIHNRIIFDQLVALCKELEFDTGEIRASKLKFGKVTIAMEKTFFNRYKSVTAVQQYVERVGLIITDEAHLASGATYQSLLLQCPAMSRLAFSGTTLEGTQKEQELIKASFGSVLVEISNEEMIEAGISSEVIVEIHPTVYSKWVGFGSYAERLRSMYQNPSRVEIISRVVNTYAKGVLIVVDKTEHGTELTKMLNLTNKVEFIHGELNMDARKAMITRFENNEIDALITTSVLQEGVNIKGIRTIVFAAGGKSPKRIKQFIGRGLRKKDENNLLTVVDFYDKVASLEAHSNARIEIYKKEKFKINEIYHI